MKVLIVRTSGSYLDYKTYNCQELGLAKALTAKGMSVSLIMAGHKEERICEDCDSGKVDIYYLKYIGLNQQLSIFLRWKQLILALHPDVIQVQDFGLYMTYAVSKWAKKQGIPCVQIQGNYEPTRKPFFKQLELLYNMTFGKATLNYVVAVGFKTPRAESYIKKYNKNVVTFATPIGLDVSRFGYICSYHNWVERLKLKGKKILLYIGCIEKRRNPDFLIKVLRVLPKDYVLLIAGKGPMEECVKRSISELNLSDRCFLLGKLKQDELPSLYNIASLFLLASSYEIYGMVIMEAMFFGVPVVSSLSAGSESLIKSGSNGFTINSFDEELWAKTIYEIVEDKKRMTSMSDAAKEKISKELLWEYAADNFQKLYEFSIKK